MISAMNMTQVQTDRETKAVKEATKRINIYGKTIGEPELSEKAEKYYEELKNKFKNKEFILVSDEMKETAKAQAGRYANPSKMVVLIDESKIERMAEDADYRAMYENIISNAGNQLSEIKNSMGTAAAGVKAFGMQVEEGGASFFAVVDKSLAMQRERIARQAEEKREEKKIAEKKAAKKEAQEQLEEKRQENRKKIKEDAKSQEVVIRAGSKEELIQKIQDLVYSWMSDSTLTDAEKQVGQHFDANV